MLGIYTRISKDRDNQVSTEVQKELGVTYIERDEDAKPEEDPDADALYKSFKNAGFGGSQEEFYETFMPDMDRTDIDMITQGLEGLSFKGADMSDPFTALGSIQGFLGDGDSDLFGSPTDDKDKEEDNEPKYFDLFSDEKEDDDIPDNIHIIFSNFIYTHNLILKQMIHYHKHILQNF